MNNKIHRLQLISQETATISHQECVFNALMGGIKYIQLRIKNKAETEVFQIAKEIKNLCSDFENVCLILNDYLPIAKELDFDGIHLGMTDTSTAEARKILGKNKLIGGTANTYEDILYHYQNGVDYVGLGPLRYTQTKNQLSPILGEEGYSTLIQKLKTKAIHLPILAIGGITTDDFKTLSQLGVYGVALASLINLDTHPILKAQEVQEEIDRQWN
jgi:thiamine-phosphate pyrophosphorylase